MYNGEIGDVEISAIRSPDIEQKGLSVEWIIVEEHQGNVVEVSFEVCADRVYKDKILKLPLKFEVVSIWGARIQHQPAYIGTFSYGKWKYGGMLQYRVVRDPGQKERLQIFLSIEGRPVPVEYCEERRR